MSRKNNIDDIFRDKLSRFQKSPPPDIWDKISESLPPGKKKKLVPVFWRYAAGIIILLGIGASWLFFNQPQNPVENLANEKQKETPKSLPQTDTESEAELQVENAETLIIKKSEVPTASYRKNQLATDFSKGIQEKETNNFNDYDASQKADEINPEQSFNSYDYRAEYTDITELPVQINPGSIKYEIAIEESNRDKNIYTWEDLGIGLSEEEPASEERKFTLAAVVSPLYSYRDIGQVSSSINEQFNQSETGKFNFAGGLNIGFIASKRLSIHSGVMYSRLGVGINDILAVAEYRQPETDALINDRNASNAYLVNNSIGSIESGSNSSTKFEYVLSNEENPTRELSTGINYLNSEGFYAPADNYIPDDGTMDQYFQYLEVPLLFKYKIIDRKIDFNLLGGLSTNFLVGNKVIYNQDGSSEVIGTTANVRTVNYSGNFGLGLDYNIADRFHLLFEPQFKYYINSINTNNLIGNRPYTLGLYSGIIYLF